MSNYLLVHGAWGGGWVWDDLASRLEKAGHNVTAVDQLPSAGTDAATLGDLTADTDKVRGVLVEQDEPVVLVGHSYGGMVITELANEPKVRHSVYLSAFWPQRGQSALDLLGDGPLPAWIVPRDDGVLAITDDQEVARDALCADLDRARTAEFLSQLALQNGAAFAVASTAPERSHPTTYIICEQDNAIPVPAQDAMSGNADNVVRLPCSHYGWCRRNTYHAAGNTAQLALPDELAESLGRI